MRFVWLRFDRIARASCPERGRSSHDPSRFQARFAGAGPTFASAVEPLLRCVSEAFSSLRAGWCSCEDARRA
ncbi:Hypothetical protein A7982_04781 [Minicystis rosea]|nr:Hypothetical protein A7982_04781 [Minicystis rosea]